MCFQFPNMCKGGGEGIGQCSKEVSFICRTPLGDNSKDSNYTQYVTISIKVSMLLPFRFQATVHITDKVCVVLPERKFGNALLSAKSFLGNHLKSSPTHSSFISLSRTISHKRLYYPLCAKESLLQTQTMKYSFNLISYFPASVLPTAAI